MTTGLYDPAPVPNIDYAKMKRDWPKVKAGLTRARNSGNPLKVRAACWKFVELCDECGAWPDDWAIFRNALEDAYEDWRLSDAADDDHFDNNGVEQDRWREIGRRFDF